MNKISLVIELGNRWRMFAMARKSMTFIGTVQRDVAGIGALARTRNGHYLQVNGDVAELLDSREIERALRMLPDKSEEQRTTHPLDQRPVADSPQTPKPVPERADLPRALASTPVITVKRRRVAVRANINASQAPEQARATAIS